MTRKPSAPAFDPHQAAEAAAFTLTPQAGPAAVDTTGDMFGFDYDDLADWTPATPTRRRQPAPGPDLFA